MLFVAVQMLVGDRGKYLGIVFGITFASLIMTQQPAIFLGLMTRTYSFIGDVAPVDVWVMNPAVEFVDDSKAMSESALYRVRGVDGVAWAVPMFKSLLSVKLPDGRFQTADVIGLDDATLIGGPPVLVEGRLEDLRRTDAIVVDLDGAADRLSWQRPDGTVAPLAVGDTVELNDRRAVVVGLGRVSRTFQSQPAVFTTYSRALGYAPPQRRQLSYVLVKVRDGEAPEAVAARISAATGLAAHTVQEFKDRTLQYWMDNTGIPINFGIAVTLGFLVGAAIAGQTFYGFTRDNLRQFGALKAMGARNGTLLRMILLQGLLVGLVGWGLGVGAAALFGLQIDGSVLAFYMPWQLLLFSGAGVTLIVLISAVASIWTVLRLEPAIVFRS